MRQGLLERLKDGGVVCGEGYLFELERRGYLQAGPFVPEVVLDRPEVVRQLHRDFVHAGSDVVEALAYYAHREKLRFLGREGAVQELNRWSASARRRRADRKSGWACARSFRWWARKGALAEPLISNRCVLHGARARGPAPA